MEKKEYKLTPTQMKIIESKKATFKNVEWEMNSGGNLLIEYDFNGYRSTHRYGRRGHSFGITEQYRITGGTI
ncbi:MAG: hypothetical protein WC549_09420 [Actinomycetota bacterium]